MTKIILKRNKAIKKQDYIEPGNKKLTEKNKLILNFDKKTDVVPKKTNRLLCIIFTEDKKAIWLWRQYNALKHDDKTDFFRFKKGMYIIDNEGVHITDNNIRVAFYLEGISTPIKMSNIEKEQKEVEYIDLQGNVQKSFIEKIKGLKFDAKIMDIFLQRRFAEIFTKVKIKSSEVYLMIFSIILIAIGCINIGASYVFR